MAKQPIQFYYYNDSDSYPSKSKFKWDGKLIEAPIIRLNIKALPGTRFYLNKNLDGPIIINSTGKYELDVEGFSEITDLCFDNYSLTRINNDTNAYLIIDAIYK